MKIGLGSCSAVKQVALTTVLNQLGIQADVVAVQASSGIREQPFGEKETLQGTKNRAAHAAQLVPDAQLWVSIESGIVYRYGHYFDVAFVGVLLPTGEFISTESESLEFPEDAVLEAFRRKTWTVGKVLAEWGRISQHDDPHLSLAGRSRSDYTKQAICLCLGGFARANLSNTDTKETERKAASTALSLCQPVR